LEDDDDAVAPDDFESFDASGEDSDTQQETKKDEDGAESEDGLPGDEYPDSDAGSNDDSGLDKTNGEGEEDPDKFVLPESAEVCEALTRRKLFDRLMRQGKLIGNWKAFLLQSFFTLF
jgi:hypothetical protein